MKKLAFRYPILILKDIHPHIINNIYFKPDRPLTLLGAMKRPTNKFWPVLPILHLLETNIQTGYSV